MSGVPIRGGSCLAAVALVTLWNSGVAAQSQTPGQITKFNSSLTSVVDSVVTEDGSGNLGVGTRTPAAKLDIVGGSLRLEDSTGATGNILKGGAIFIHNFGFENTFIGSNAGNIILTGAANTGTGFLSLFSNTSGEQNTATGGGSLLANTTGSYNTATGLATLRYNTGGSFNSANGYYALVNNASADGNTASGAFSLYSNTTGLFNGAAGAYSLFSNVNGDYNTAAGTRALFSNTSGTYNAAYGAASLHNSTTGQENAGLGHGALRTNSTGNFNTAVGSGADVSTDGFTNATAIGANAIVTSSNRIRLGSSAVQVIEGQVPYTFTSDRNQKERFQPVDAEEVLKKLGGLSLTSWNYIGHDPQEYRHYGPVAQEFFAAFGHDGVGTVGTPKTINSGDLEGILMIAVQALEKRTAENADLKARIEALEALVQKRPLQEQ